MDLLPHHNVGWAVIVVTLIVRLILLPSSLHQARAMARNQAKMKSINAKLEAIKKEHKDDKAKQSEATMRLYKEHGINPASGCLPLLIQLPILIALYQVFLRGISTDSFQQLYSFVPAPSQIGFDFFGLPLNQPSLAIAVIAGLAQFAQMYFFSPTQPTQPGQSDDTAKAMASMQKNMTYFFPLMTVFIAVKLPAALGFYWITTTLFGIVQQYWIKKSMHLEGNPPIV